MEIKKAQFVKSAASYNDCIVSDLAQIAIVGKSNVGKSSFINMLVNDSKLARTSKQPGRTRLINYFLINESYFLVDLPGYGYAEVSRDAKLKWRELIESYLNKESMLSHVFFLVDVRHDPTSEDLIMYNYLFKCNIPFTIITTKADKLAKSKIKNQSNHLASIYKVGFENVIATSSTNNYGKQAVLDKIDQILANVTYSHEHTVNEDTLNQNEKIDE